MRAVAPMLDGRVDARGMLLAARRRGTLRARAVLLDRLEFGPRVPRPGDDGLCELGFQQPGALRAVGSSLARAMQLATANMQSPTQRRIENALTLLTRLDREIDSDGTRQQWIGEFRRQPLRSRCIGALLSPLSVARRTVHACNNAPCNMRRLWLQIPTSLVHVGFDDVYQGMITVFQVAPDAVPCTAQPRPLLR